MGSKSAWLLVWIAATGVFVVWFAPDAVSVIVIDLISALLVLLPAALAGLWLLPPLGYGQWPVRWQLLLGGTLGIGLLSVLILLMGLIGQLGRPVWLSITVVFLAVGVLRLRWLLRRSSHLATDGREADASGHQPPSKALWLCCAPFFALALVAASNAPGFVWQEEGFGYDVLEYHLQMPKEYHQAGHIIYAPHNVYANFPAAVEMLYLLAMTLLKTDIEAGTTANMIHLLLGLGAVGWAWLIARQWSARAGWFAAMVLASVGWMAYLSGLAYVELGMLFFGLASLAILLRNGGAGSCPSQIPVSQGSSSSSVVRWEEASCSSGHWLRDCAMGGVLAGFACSCKYTAVPMVALPLAVVAAIAPVCGWRCRTGGVAAFALACLVGFSPWLVKNQMMTGNPVFPLVNDVFNAQPPGWGEAQTQQWDRAHAPQPNQRSLRARLDSAWIHLPADHDQRFGPAIFLLAIGGLFVRKRNRVDAALLLAVVMQLAVWLWATHLFARFAIVLLIPLVVLAARSALAPQVWSRRVAIVTLLLGAVWNFGFTFRLQERESSFGAPASLLYNGQLPGFEYFDVMNHKLPEDAKVLLVGDARAFYYLSRVDYTVVFNRNPFIEILKSHSDVEVVNWLRKQGYTHVLVHWQEIDRLRRTYGFSEVVTPERFNGLSAAGLEERQRFSHPRLRSRYVSLYKVPQ